MEKPRRGDVIEVTVKGLDEKGRGAGSLDGYTVRVRGALPGDCVRAVVGRVRHRAREAEARKVEVLQAGIERIPARCPHFGACGGCLWQDVPYDRQVGLKQQMVVGSLRAAGIACKPDEPIWARDPFYYRNKMEFSFAASPEGALVLGLHMPGRFDRVFDLEACFLQSEWSNRLVSHTRAFAVKCGLRVYDLKRHTGLLRFLTIREGKQTGEGMVVLTTSEEPFPEARAFANELVSAFPGMTSVVHCVNRRKAQVATGDEERVLAGTGRIRECVGGFGFDISPRSFFQTNTLQAERLYRRVTELADLSGGERALDVYCGTGGISFHLAPSAREVLGIECVADAVRDAEGNRAINHLGNCSFIAGQAEEGLEGFCREGARFDVGVIDPPRAGVHPRALACLAALAPTKLIYVSCNPQTLGRDLAFLEQSGYRTDYLQMVDMFPHTPHCEVVARLVQAK